jgi:hypothetical protein
MKNQKSYLELKIVANNLQEIERLIKWSEYLGFIHDGYSQEENGLYWTFLKINNGLIEEPKKASELFGDCIIEDLPIETDTKIDLIVNVKKKALVALYDFAYQLAKENEEKLTELKEIDLLLND